jgi:hypothetical protein
MKALYYQAIYCLVGHFHLLSSLLLRQQPGQQQQQQQL